MGLFMCCGCSQSGVSRAEMEDEEFGRLSQKFYVLSIGL